MVWGRRVEEYILLLVFLCFEFWILVGQERLLLCLEKKQIGNIFKGLFGCWAACDDLFMDAAGKGSSQREGVGNSCLSVPEPGRSERWVTLFFLT